MSSGGEFDGGDHVVTREEGAVGINDAAAVVDREVVGVDADSLEHGDEQGGFVFAVAVAIAEDVSGVVWPASRRCRA